MKLKQKLYPWIPPTVFGLLLAGSTCLAGPPDYFFNTFSNSTEIATYFHGWGGVSENATFDESLDISNNATSGSMKLAAVFDSVGNADNQFAWLHALNGNAWGFWDANAVLQSSNYLNFEFDIFFANSCPADSAGRVANLEHVLVDYQNTAGASWVTTTFYPTNTGHWIHVVHPIPPSFPPMIAGCGFKIWSESGGSGLTGTTTFWLDNVKLTPKVGPTLPPTLGAPHKVAAPGLWLGIQDGGQRQGVYTPYNQIPWYQVATPENPVSYSMTIAHMPDPAHFAGIQTHMMIVGDVPAATSAIDWNGAHVLFLRIIDNADGSAYANLWFKTNSPMSYGNMIYSDGPHHLVTNLNSATIKGKWTLSFTSDTAGSLRTPDGSVTNFVIPSDAAALFALPYAVFGIQGNDNANAGQGVTLGKIEIQSSGSVALSDTFDAPPLNTGIWGVAAATVSGVQVIPDGLWLDWSLPAWDFNLWTSATVNAPLDTWTTGLITFPPAPGITPFTLLEKGHTVIPWASLPDTNHVFFIMEHPPVP